MVQTMDQFQIENVDKIFVIGSMPTCEMGQLPCVRLNKHIFNAALPGTNSSTATLKDSPCNCWPDCELLQYVAEVTSGVLNRKYSLNSMAFL